MLLCCAFCGAMRVDNVIRCFCGSDATGAGGTILPMAADPPGRTDVADPSKPQLQHAVVVGEVPHVGCDVCDLQAKHDDYVREATETIDLLERERDEALVRADIAEGGTGTI